MLGKHHKAPFEPTTVWRAHTPLEHVQGDLCYMNKPSLVGEKYIVTFIGDFSKFTWVYLFKRRDMCLKSSRNLGN